MNNSLMSSEDTFQDQDQYRGGEDQSTRDDDQTTEEEVRIKIEKKEQGEDETVLLILYLHQGRNFTLPSHLSGGLTNTNQRQFSLQAVATLEDNTTVETSPVPFTSDPDFQEEIGWRMTWGMLENLRKKKENIKVQVFAKEQSLGGSKHLIGGCAISVDRAHETRKVGLSGSIQYQTSWVKLKSDHVLPKTPKLKLDLAYEKTSQSETAEDSFMYQTDEVSLMETEPAPHTEVVLNEEKGYFVIRDGGNAKDLFEFTVQLVFAKNLQMALPRDFVLPSPEANFQFSYLFLGCEINSKPFSDLKDPKMTASMATARIKATPEDLERFVSSIEPIVVKLVCGRMTLAKAEILPSKQLEAIDPEKVMNGHEATCDGIVTFGAKSAEHENAASPDSNNKPILGFSVEVKYTGPDRDDQEPIDRIDAQPVGQQQQQRNEDQMFKKSLETAVTDLEEWKLRQKTKFQQQLRHLEAQHGSVLAEEFRRREEQRERAIRAKMQELTEMAGELRKAKEETDKKAASLETREKDLQLKQQNLRDKENEAKKFFQLMNSDTKKKAILLEEENVRLKLANEKMAQDVRNLEEDKKHLEDVRPKFQALKVQVEQLKQSNEHYKEAWKSSDAEFKQLRAENDKQLQAQLKESREEIDRLRTELEVTSRVRNNANFLLPQARSSSAQTSFGMDSTADVTNDTSSHLLRLRENRAKLLKTRTYREDDEIIRSIDKDIEKLENKRILQGGQ